MTLTLTLTRYFATQAAIGELHTLALDNSSSLVSFGHNARHELG